MRLTIREAGWALLDPSASDPALVAVLRFERTSTGRLAVAEMVLARHPAVTPGALRALRLGQVELYANGPGREAILKALADRETMTDDERGAVDAQQRADADTRARWGTTAEAGDAIEGRAPALPLRSRVRSLRLDVPEGQPKPDRFYREVARIYSDVAVGSTRPALDIAEANSVPRTTVHGWLKEARRRGFLAPAERQGRKRR